MKQDNPIYCPFCGQFGFVVSHGRDKESRYWRSICCSTNWLSLDPKGHPLESPAQHDLDYIGALIEEEEYELATARIDRLRDFLGEFPTLTSLATQIAVIECIADEKPLMVKIEVRGGVAHIVHVPSGAVVELQDHDNEETTYHGDF